MGCDMRNGGFSLVSRWQIFTLQLTWLLLPAKRQRHHRIPSSLRDGCSRTTLRNTNGKCWEGGSNNDILCVTSRSIFLWKNLVSRATCISLHQTKFHSNLTENGLKIEVDYMMHTQIGEEETQEPILEKCHEYKPKKWILPQFCFLNTGF